MIRLTLYSKPGCHLCEEMKEVLGRVGRRVAITLDEIDISTDDALRQLYELEIPVLLIEGRKVAKYRVTEEQLLRRIRDIGKGV